MIHPIDHYNTLVFDCDGVVLDSNRIKTDAFYQAALPYGAAAAAALVQYHTSNGGISRYVKFAHFLDQIVPAHAPGTDGPDIDALLEHYAQAVYIGLTRCAVAEGLADLRSSTTKANWLIVSGGDQAELKQIFGIRGISDYFDGGIFGSPDTKNDILGREILRGNIRLPALFLGDSKYDHSAASTAGLDFVFVSGWSEVADWKTYTEQHNLPFITAIRDL